MKAAEEAKKEAQEKEEKARGEKLAAELSVWEIEGKIDSFKDEAAQAQQKADVLNVQVHYYYYYFLPSPFLFTFFSSSSSSFPFTSASILFLFCLLLRKLH